MQKLLRISVVEHFGIFARTILLGLILYFVIQDYGSQTELLLFLLFVLILIIFAETYKDISRFRKKPASSWNIVLLFVASAVLLLIDKQNLVLVYYFFLLPDTIYLKQPHKEVKIRYRLLTFHFAAFVIHILLDKFQSSPNLSVDQFLATVFSNVAGYGLILYIVFSIHYYKYERDRLLTLNNDLINYSFQESQYLIAAERSRISQQFHDSIGHSLIAVLMNIRYLKAIHQNDPSAGLMELNEMEALVKESVEGLRNSLNSLKELDDHLDLRGEIERLAARFNKLGVVRIGFQYDEAIDKAPNCIKSVLHENIREGITNSIRHSDADRIEIRLQTVKDNQIRDTIELVIKDNGKGCEHIANSNGLNGILERVKSVNGEAYFRSRKGKGFEICNLIPWEDRA